MQDTETNTPSGPEAGPEGQGKAWPLSLLSLLACGFLFAMMLINFADVVGRYLFLSPLPAAYEIISLIMPAIIFLALPLSVLRNNHVTVDIFDFLRSPRTTRVQSVVVDLFGAATMAFLSWRLAVRSMDQHRWEEVSDELYLELWPFSAVMSALCAVTVLVFLTRLGRGLARMLNTRNTKI